MSWPRRLVGHSTVDLVCRTHGIELALAFRTAAAAAAAHTVLTLEHLGCEHEHNVTWDIAGPPAAHRVLVPTP